MCFLLAVIAIPLHAKDAPKDPRSKKEVKADLAFRAQKFPRAELLYSELLSDKNLKPDEKDRLNLKLARLYYNTKQYELSEKYFEKIIHNPLALKTQDVCNFIDILVRFKKFRRAEEVSLLYLDKLPYIEDTRFINIQKGLNGLIRYMMSDSSQFTVRVAPFSSTDADFWCTFLGENILFIRTPVFQVVKDKDNKITGLYTDDRTQQGKSKNERILQNSLIKGARFHVYDGQSVKVYDKISTTMQAGPAAILADGSMMVYTDNRYGNSIPRKTAPGEVVTNALVLKQINYDGKRKKWGKPIMLFSDDETVSYCHPAFSPDGKSLYFASNMPGGYGGLDIYVSHWDGRGWGSPINLGPEVNTSGEEVFPSFQNGRLQFSSNGHIGLGGVDVYSVGMVDNVPARGTLRHMPYPVNTSANDYAILYTSIKDGYISSDRPGSLGVDDIYRFIRNTTSLEGRGDLDLDQGGLLLTADGRHINQATARVLGIGHESIPITDEEAEGISKVMYTGKVEVDQTIYFGYNNANLDKEAVKQLNKFVEENGLVVASIVVLGYADETGAKDYNFELSKRRAEAVKNFLVAQGYSPSYIKTTAIGQIKLTPEEEIEANDIKKRLTRARKAEIKFVFEQDKKSK